MSKNHMKEVAAMLGVELGEEFEIYGDDNKYRFKQEGLFSSISENCTQTFVLERLLNGTDQIVRRPWRPKRGEKFWFIDIQRDESYLVDWCTYGGGSFDIHYILMGNCFPSREAAKAAAPEVLKFYEDVRSMMEE